MNISVCLDALYGKYDFIHGMKTVKKLGFDVIEFWSWWDKNLQDIKTFKENNGMTISAFCTKFISLTDATKHDEYLKGLQASIEAAKYLGCSTLITQVGDDTGKSRVVQHNNIIQGLKMCTGLLEASGITLVMEPLNTVLDHEGYYLSSAKEAFDIVNAVGNKHIKVLYDVYHQSLTKGSVKTEGDVLTTIREHMDLIGHFHVAGCPGRGELYTGEIDYKEIFNVINSTNYNGFIGLEYFPVEAPGVGLKKFLKDYTGNRQTIK